MPRNFIRMCFLIPPSAASIRGIISIMIYINYIVLESLQRRLASPYRLPFTIRSNFYNGLASIKALRQIPTAVKLVI